MVFRKDLTGKDSMKATMLYRITSFLLLVFAIGSAYGLMKFHQASESMSNVQFHVGHAGFTFSQVMLCFLMFFICYVLFEAYLAWHLSTLALTSPQAVGALRWVLVAYQLVAVLISRTFFAGIVTLFSIVITLCLVWASWLSTGAPTASAAAKR